MLPLKFLEKQLNLKISLLLKDNRILTGRLLGYDEYMNFVIDDVEEITEKSIIKLGIVILRGTSVISIAQST